MAVISGGGFFSRFRNRINDTTSGVNPVEDITPIETNDTDVEANTTTIPTNAGSMESDINNRTTGGEEDESNTSRVGNFSEIGYISLFGEYPQNRIDIPRYDLSNVVSLHTNIANFNFILSLKNGDDVPQLFANKNVMIELIAKYGRKEPIPVNHLINQRKLVVIDIAPLNDLTNRMRAAELSINLNRNETNGQIEVTRNLYTYSNYQVGDGGILVAEPSYDLNELIKYITWVVTKPNSNYDERLIPANELGEWNGSVPEPPAEDEPPTDTTNVPDNTSFPPIGRAGIEDAEEVMYDNQVWVWSAEFDIWQPFDVRYGSGNQNGNTGSGNQNGNTGSGNQGGGNTGSGNQGGGEPDS
tara:strand:+ start:61 stop:1131 length:1071 start_codon:yes stop_codon:yes gene_type:complete